LKLAKNFPWKKPGKEVDEMKNEIWKFDGIWNGDCYRDCYSVDEITEYLNLERR